ncbi:MAG: DUF1574 family protein [Candidatus Omnitrophica bacterium]|nr:DUF1574 family protein [Candidatus Omnitrophota bacterium]
MVAENLFTFSFKKLPKAFLICLVLIIGANAIVIHLVDNDILEISPYRHEYRYQLEQAQNKRADVVIIGDSSALYINTEILKNALFTNSQAQILNLSVGGAMPRTFSYILNNADYQCVNDNGLVIFCLRPMDFNRYNICFERTMISYFSWKEFFSELVAEKRMDDVRYFLQKCSLYLINYRFEIKAVIKRYINENIIRVQAVKKKKARKVRIIKPEYDKEHAKRKEVTMMLYKNNFIDQYTLDEYQIRHMNMIIGELKQRNIRVVLVIMPVSSAFMRVVGMKDLKLFRNKIRDVSSEQSIDLLDFLSGSKGDEFRYFDGMHFIRESEIKFSQILSVNIRKILNK